MVTMGELLQIRDILEAALEFIPEENENHHEAQAMIDMIDQIYVMYEGSPDD